MQQVYEGFTLKQQPLGEADIILTFFSLEQGKLRAVLKSAKRPASKLQGNLQPFIYTRLSMVGKGSLPTVVGSEAIQQFTELVSSQSKMHAILCVQEFLNRALPDAEPNLVLFNLTRDYYQFLNTFIEDDKQSFLPSLAQFYSKGLEAVGLAPQLINSDQPIPPLVYFNVTEGGFSKESRSSTDIQINQQDYLNYQALFVKDFGYEVPIDELIFKLILQFAGYQLDRELRSSSYFLDVL